MVIGNSWCLSLEFFVFLTYTYISKNPFFSKWDSIEGAMVESKDLISHIEWWGFVVSWTAKKRGWEIL